MNMGTAVASLSRSAPFCRELRSVCPELKSGSLILVAMNGRRQGVNVKVYRTSLEHFAVIYPQKKICRPLGVLNLKNVSLVKENLGFSVRQKNYESPMTLTFLVEQVQDLEEWLLAFSCRKTSPMTRRNCHLVLPIVEEGEES